MKAFGIRWGDSAGVLLIGGALMLLSGCAPAELPNKDQPVATVRGNVVTEDGSPARGCKLEFYDTATIKPNFAWDIPATFSRKVQTAKLVNDFYFRVRCEGERVAARSRVFNMAYLTSHDFTLDLGRMTVGAGMVSVTGKVATMDGSKPAACQLGLYTGFHRDPVESWKVNGDIAIDFKREKIDGHFHFELRCDGYAQPYISPARPESWLAGVGGKVELGAMLVRK